MGRAVLITDNIRRIRVANNQLIGEVAAGDPPPQPIPCEDLDLIIVEGTIPVMLDTYVLRILTETKTVLVITDRKHMPVGISLPLFGTLDRGRVLDAQFNMSIPRKKQLWQQLVKSKILNQAANIANDSANLRLRNIARSVKSGDSNNDEAVAAKIYWQAIVDFPFHRRPSENIGLNAALNFTYSIVRSLIARAITSVGIESSLSVFHSNRVNPFAFVDDLMEPFRPIADHHVLVSDLDRGDELTVLDRKKLVSVMSSPVRLGERIGPLSEVAIRYADDVKRYIFNEIDSVVLPARVLSVNNQ